MGEQTNISWADHTYNHWIGCMKVSPACDGCYAARLMDERLHRVEWGEPGKGPGTRSLTSEANHKTPLTWNRAAIAAGTRPFVFCSSLADVFDNQIPLEWRYGLFDIIRSTPALVWLLLTKRPQNIVQMIEAAGPMPANIALGTTCEDQRRYDQNAKHLAFAKSALRPLFTFISAEPLLGPLNLYVTRHGALDPDWVITGGETDQGQHMSRPTHPEWFRSLRDQCAKAGIAYHHKQNGEWLPVSALSDAAIDKLYARAPRRDPEATRRPLVPTLVLDADGTSHSMDDRQPFLGKRPMMMFKVGKEKSGRLLDGVEHNQFPPQRSVANASLLD